MTQLREVAAGLGVQIDDLRSSVKVRYAQIINARRQIEELKKRDRKYDETDNRLKGN